MGKKKTIFFGRKQSKEKNIMKRQNRKGKEDFETGIRKKMSLHSEERNQTRETKGKKGRSWRANQTFNNLLFCVQIGGKIRTT